MSTKRALAFAVVALVFAVPAFLFGPTIWPDPADAPVPTPAQVPHLTILSIVDALTLGVGAAFLVFGWPFVRDAMPHHRRAALLSYLATAWLLVSWWPHANAHRANGTDITGLIKIDYGFHVTLMIAGFIIAYCFAKFLQPPRKTAAR